MKQETKYQASLTRRLKDEYPGCVIIKNDPRYIQGIPDLLILYHDRWAMLEVKTSEDAPSRPNQEHYVAEFARLSYAAIIFPENEDRVLYELQFALRP